MRRWAGVILTGVLLSLPLPAGVLAQAAGKPDRQVVTAVKGQTIRGVVGAMGSLYIVPEVGYRVTGSKVTGSLRVTYQAHEGIIITSSARTGTASANLKLFLEGGRTVTVQVAVQPTKKAGQSYLVIR